MPTDHPLTGVDVAEALRDPVLAQAGPALTRLMDALTEHFAGEPRDNDEAAPVLVVRR